MCLMSVTEMFDILFSFLENLIMKWLHPLLKNINRISIHINKYLLYVILS